jgi:ATP-dependent exoDNAse (exonuclease V) alpha subunit
MVAEKFYKYFISLKRMRPDIKFIISGDFAQLLPVCDRIEDCDYENSPALHELADGNKLILNKCRRSDDILYKICLDVKNALKDDFNNAESKKNLCFTNEMRKKINIRKMNEDLKINRSGKKLKTVSLLKYKFDGNSQDITVCSGMPIIARKTTDEYSIMNNETFTICKVDDEYITISDTTRSPLQIPVKDFTRLFHLAYCITVHKSQGETYNTSYTIYEWSKFSDRMKYVALSRATKKECINII